MPSACQPQLRSAIRIIVQQSSPLRSIRHPSQREFHRTPVVKSSQPFKDDGNSEANTSSTPILENVPGIDETPKQLKPCCAENVKLEELHADPRKRRVDVEKLLRKQDIDTRDNTDDKREQIHDTPTDDDSRPELKQPALSFHGSALRRRRRSSAARKAQEIDQHRTPPWFLNWNVQLAKERHNSEGFAQLTGILNSSGDSPDREPGPGSSTNNVKSNDIDASSERHDGVPLTKEKHSTFDVQMRELEIIARGLLRLPTSGRLQSTDSNHDGPHLMLDHQDQWIETPGAVWRDLVEDLASRLECDFLALNAQDVGELISGAALGEDITSEAVALNYEVSNKVLRARDIGNMDLTNSRHEKFGVEPNMPWKDDGPEDSDDFEETPMDGRMPPFNTPMIIGKPITIDITKMLRGQVGKRGGSRKAGGPASFMTALFDNEPEKSTRKDEAHIFSDIISGILSSPKEKRSRAEAELSQADTSADRACEKRLLIYVEALDVLEDHNLGRQFLSELYRQVQRRRISGHQQIVVGAPPYVSEERTNWVNGLDTGSATRKVALTPPNVAPQDVSKLTRVSAQNITAINYRNLRAMLQTKWNTEAWEIFDPHSHTFLEDVARTSSMPETISLWDIHFVRQLAAVIWGMLEQGPDIKPSISEALALLDESARSKAEWRKQRSKDRSSHLVTSPEDNRISRIRSSATKHEKALLAGVIEPAKLSVTFKDVHAPFETIEAIHTLTTLSLIRPEAFRYGVLASDRLPGLLLYGPPGTGKTLLAKAVAKESGATVLSVSSAQLNDMYVGEGEKNVAALFSLAKKLTPCVIFLDEADAIFSARGNRGSRVNHRELLNQFLTEWDGMSNDANGAFIMVATNRPMDLDDAVLRRLPRRLLVDLPTESDRLAILNIHLRDEVLAEDVNLAEIAKKTPFYSGSDLKNLAVAAALECVREENEAAKKHVGEEAYKHAEKRTLNAAHFKKALVEISASISEDMESLRDIKKFDEQYGDKRGKRRRSARWGFNTAAEADNVLDTVKIRA